jgi:hypothetical protein
MSVRGPPWTKSNVDSGYLRRNSYAMALWDVAFNGRLMSYPSPSLAAALCLCRSQLGHLLTLARFVRQPLRILQWWKTMQEHHGPWSLCLFLLYWPWVLPLLAVAPPRASLRRPLALLALLLHGARQPAVDTSPPPRSLPGLAMRPAIAGSGSDAGCARSETGSLSMSEGVSMHFGLSWKPSVHR